MEESPATPIPQILATLLGSYTMLRSEAGFEGRDFVSGLARGYDHWSRSRSFCATSGYNIQAFSECPENVLRESQDWTSGMALTRSFCKYCQTSVYISLIFRISIRL